MPLSPSNMTGDASGNGLSEKTHVLRLREQTPSETPEKFVSSQDQNIRPKVESHVRKILGGP